jgi:hypothetical protein
LALTVFTAVPFAVAGGVFAIALRETGSLDLFQDYRAAVTERAVLQHKPSG